MEVTDRMTDQDEYRPLSRREIRLREMAAAGATSTDVAADLTAQEPQAAPAAESAAPAEPAVEIDIPLFDENGRQRSRRELRELREQALAERAAASEDASAEGEDETSARTPTEVLDALGFEAAPAEAEQAEHDAVETPEEAEAETASVVDAGLVETEAGAEVEPEPAKAAESVLAETVAFDVIDDQQAIKEAEAFAASQLGAQPEVIVSTDFDSLLQGAVVEAAEAEAADAVLETDAEIEPERASDEEVVADADGIDGSAHEAEPEAQPESAAADENADPLREFEAASLAEGEAAAGAEEVSENASEQSAEPNGVAAEDRSAFAAPVSAAKNQGYSFPDITPLDEGHSIFDDPALRVVGSGAADAGSNAGSDDFDDLITRAVAQEGAASTTNTSALILPSLPDAENLAGPLGETGELFITGSFDLPKSLSETGGHSALHDSVEAEQLDELGFSEPTPTGMMAPVSASRAVSARGTQGALVAEATKDKSKMPVVLIATGGVLVLGAAGLIVWAAASGLFG